MKTIERNESKEEGPRVLASLKKEIRIHKQLKNEHVVQYLNSFQDKSNFYILLEYCEKGEFFNVLQQEKKLDLTRVKDYGMQLAKGINYLHNLNIVHRDLKLGNLFLTSTNLLVVAV